MMMMIKAMLVEAWLLLYGYVEASHSFFRQNLRPEQTRLQACT